MSLEALVTKYIISTEKVLKEMQQAKGTINVTEEDIVKILDYVTNYLEDAKYYKAQERFETSLTSIAYCEGLLDALRLLGAVKFEWPAKAERKK
jgi:FAD synthetase